MANLTKSELQQKVESGLRRKELAELYDVPEIEMARYLRFFGLKIKKVRAKKEPKYNLIDDTFRDEPTVGALNDEQVSEMLTK